MALRNNLVIGGYPNPVRADLTEITAGSVGSTLTESNLKTIEPSEPLRITSIFPHESEVTIDFQVATPVQLIAQFADSLVPGDQLRVIGVASGSLPAVRSQSLPPTAIEASTNTGATDTTEIDEHPINHDESDIGPTNDALPWSVRLSFGTPTNPPAIGSEYQCFALWATMVEIPSGPGDYPTVTASLYESGVLRRVLGTKVITGVTGQLILFPWNAADLSNSNGSGAEVLLEFTAGTFTSGRLDSFAWDCLYQTAVDAVSGPTNLDTGWVTRQGQSPDPTWGNTTIEQTDQINSQWAELLSTARNLERIRVEYRADGIGYFDNFQVTEPRVPATYIDVGIISASAIFDAPYRFAPGGTLRWEHFPVGGDGLSGANREVTQWLRRVADIILETLPNSVAHSVFARLDRNGPNHPIIVILEPWATGTIRDNGMFYAVVTEARGLTFLPDGMVDGERTKSLGYTLTERL